MTLQRFAVVCALALVLAGCEGASISPSNSVPPVATQPAANSTSVASASASPTATPRPVCPVPDGGTCLGSLAAGTYVTGLFEPTMDYTVPTGWQNLEDLRGNFSLLPPGGTAAGVNAGTSDYLGVFTSVAADAADCTAAPAAGVDVTAGAIAHALATRPGLTATAPKAVTVSGHAGFVLDVRLAKGWKSAACPVTMPNVPLLVGVSPSDFEHAILGTVVIRIYLFDNGNQVLGIEVDDVTGGSRLDAYDVVVRALRFAST